MLKSEGGKQGSGSGECDVRSTLAALQDGRRWSRARVWWLPEGESGLSLEPAGEWRPWSKSAKS